jgi:hypothetical protein
MTAKPGRVPLAVTIAARAVISVRIFLERATPSSNWAGINKKKER